MPMASRAALYGALLASPLMAFATGCFSGESSTIGTASPTLVTLEPDAFLRDLACGSYPGAARVYVATLIDVSVDPPFRLPASGPIPCHLGVSFAYVVPGHGYTAAIEVYDREDLVPLGGAESGSPVMLDAQTGERVAPTWTTRCGEKLDDADGPATIARDLRNVRVQSCATLTRAKEAGATRITIDPADMLAGLQCGGEQGRVERYAVVPSDASITPEEASCGETLAFDVAPGHLYSFAVSAFEAGRMQPRWAARCEATSQAGVTLPSSCTPFSSRGSVRLKIAELLSQRGHACSASDIESYDLLLGNELAVSGASCAKDAIVGPVEAGSYDLSVVALGRSNGKLAPKLTVHCPKVAIAPGARVETSCAP